MPETKDAKPAKSVTAAMPEPEPDAVIECSSPPCLLHELDPAWLGLPRPEREAGRAPATVPKP